MSVAAMLRFISELPSYGGPAGCLPNCSAVYFVLDHTRQVRYVGATVALRERWRSQRVRFCEIEGLQAVRVAWVRVHPDNLRTVEHQFMQKLWPSHNRQKFHRYPKQSNGNGHR